MNRQSMTSESHTASIDYRATIVVRSFICECDVALEQYHSNKVATFNSKMMDLFKKKLKWTFYLRGRCIRTPPGYGPVVSNMGVSWQITRGFRS